jgi:hypothetical protein
MTAAGIRTPPRGAGPAPALRPVTAWLRLASLHAASRRLPAAAGLLAALGGLLWAELHWHWNIAGGPAAQQVIPLVIETGAAAVIAVASYGPFGEPERDPGRWMALLLVANALALTAVAAAALAAGATGGYLPGGTLALLRNVSGMIGIGLLCAVVLGGAFGWTGPMAYWLITESALAAGWTTPWIWPGRPPHDAGAAICAGLAFAAGLAVFTVRGARITVRD